MKASLGFWAAVALVVVRGASVAPALAAREPGIAPRAGFAAFMIALYVAGTLLAARRIRGADAEAAANHVWIQGMAGLIVIAVFLWLL
jgi:hypothetical protein